MKNETSDAYVVLGSVQPLEPCSSSLRGYDSFRVSKFRIQPFDFIHFLKVHRVNVTHIVIPLIFLTDRKLYIHFPKVFPNPKSLNESKYVPRIYCLDLSKAITEMSGNQCQSFFFNCSESITCELSLVTIKKRQRYHLGQKI